MKRLFLLLAFLLAAAPAHADIYAQPTWDNLVHSLVRFGALELTDDVILDEYAAITDCDIYHAFHEQDFKWHEVRDAMRKSVEMNLTKYPGSYVYEDKLLLGRYDFKDQMYYFSEKNPLQKVNAFFMFRAAPLTCHETTIRFIPKAFRAILDESVSIPGLPLTQRSADALLRRMDANNNKERAIYVRFNLHINYIGKLSRNPNASDTSFVQQGAPQNSPALLNAQVDTIDFFEDERHTKLLYSYQP